MVEGNNARVTAKVVEARLNEHSYNDRREHDRLKEGLDKIGDELVQLRERLRGAEVRLAIIIAAVSFLASLLSALVVKWL
jgi:hypothetical protein